MIEGPPLIQPRWRHSSCAIQSEDGSTESIIIIGGQTDPYYYNRTAVNTTEILHLKDPKWLQGPKLPLGIRRASCVELPLTSSFACVLIGGYTEEEHYSSCVYGLNRRLTEWTYLGEIRTGRHTHVALPIS